MQVAVKALGYIQANCYIINNSLMIDPGDDEAGLDHFIKEQNAHITHVAITHGHLDHMLGAAHMQSAYGAKLFISPEDADALASPEALPVPGYMLARFTPCRADGALLPGETDLAGVRFEVIPTPGHTPGGVCLYSAGDKQLFTGDTLFCPGYGRTDLPGGDMSALIASLKTLLSLPGDTYVWPGHGEGGTIAQIKRSFV